MALYSAGKVQYECNEVHRRNTPMLCVKIRFGAVFIVIRLCEKTDTPMPGMTRRERKLTEGV